MKSGYSKSKQTFLWLWSGQLISNLGTQTTLYGIGLWFFARTDRLVDFALVALVVQLARIIILPVLANRLDNWSRRNVMLIANGIGALCTISLAIMLLKGGSSPSLYPILLVQGVAAMAEASLILSFSSLIPILFIEEKELIQANGVFATTDSLVLTMAPFLGSWLGGAIGLEGVLTLDACSFFLALICVLAAPWGIQFKSFRKRRKLWTGLHLWQSFQEVKNLWVNLPLSRVAIVIGTAVAFSYGATEILFPAWVAVAYGTKRMAAVLFIASLGYSLGFLAWQKKLGFYWRSFWLIAIFIQSLILMGAGLMEFSQKPIFWFGGVFLFSAGLPVVMSSIQQAWSQLTNEKEISSIFALRYGFEWSARLIAFLCVSLAVDHLVQPTLQWPNLPLWLQSSLGIGEGRAIAVTLGAMGWILVIAIGSQFRNLRSTRSGVPG